MRRGLLLPALLVAGGLALGCVGAVKGEGSCGNGVLDSSEQCEGENLGGQTCASLGFSPGGALSCAADCTLITTGCLQQCGNEQAEPGEECDGQVVNASCPSWGPLTCNDECRIDRSACADEVLADGQRLEYPDTAYVAAATALEDEGASAPTLLVTSVQERRVDILTWSSSTQLTAAGSIALDATLEPLEPHVADLNGDGASDLVVLYKASAKVDLSLSSAQGFAAHSLTIGCNPTAAWAELLDPDEYPELVFGCSADGVSIATVLVYQNLLGDTDATTSFVRKSTLTLGEPTPFLDLKPFGESMELALLAQRPSNDSLATYAGDGAFGFVPSGSPLAVGQVPGEFAAEDFDEDALQDIVALQTGRLAVLKNGQDGFTLLGSASVDGTSPHLVRVLDLDLDGKTREILVATDTQLHVLKGFSGASGSRVQTLTLGFVATSIAVSDLDNDGDSDVIVAGKNAAKGEVLLLTNKVH